MARHEKGQKNEGQGRQALILSSPCPLLQTAEAFGILTCTLLSDDAHPEPDVSG